MATVNDFSSVNFLGSSMVAFRKGNRGEGFKNFGSVCPQDQNKIYEQIWLDSNRPQGNLEYGRQSFNDTNGLYSTVQEKAEAINKYLKSKTVGNEDRLAVNDGIRWVPNTGAMKRPSFNGDQRPEHKFRVKDCPQTKDECLGVGLSLTVCGAIVAVCYAIKKCLQK